MKKAIIHHKDGDATNNPIDGSNWEALCWKCHRKIPARRNNSGISIVALFAPWKRAEIIRSRDYRCERCSAELTTQRLSNKPRPKCITCGRIIERKKDGRLLKDGKIICIECFGEEVIMAKGQKHIMIEEYTYDLLQRIINGGRASDIDDAIRRSASKYLDITYKSKKHIKIEQELAHVQELAKKATKE